MARINTSVALLVLAGGAAAAWVGITDPPDGFLGTLGDVLHGQPIAKKAAAAGGILEFAPSLYNPGGSGASSSASATDASLVTSGGSAAGAAIVAQAAKLKGLKYVYGGTSPTKGMDCSGYSRYCVQKAIGYELPRTAAAQQSHGQLVGGLAHAEPGDLLFQGLPAHHVAIFAGGGMLWEEPETGQVCHNIKVWFTPTTIRRVTGLGSTSKATISA